MSLIKTKSIQLGWDLTPTNNFTIYQPATPDGTFRIATGNAGSTTDVMTVSSTGAVTYAGTVSYSGLGFGTGSATAPSIFPNGDTNTGLYFPTAETIGFSTNGTERVRISSTGNVGINLQSPQFKLSANQGVNTAAPDVTSSIQIFAKGYAGSGQQYAGIGFAMNEHAAGYWGSGILSRDDSGNFGSALSFYTSTGSTTPSPVERMRIDSTGKVGIGTGAPAYNLHINTANSNAWLCLQRGSNTNIAFMTYADENGTNKWGHGMGTPSSNLFGIFNYTTGPDYALAVNTTGGVSLQGASRTADGVGITFPANQSASSNANTLDDYEEGTWTPTLASGTMNVRSAMYTKIGRQVTVQIWADTFSSTVNIIGGLPFVAAANCYSPGVAHNNSGNAYVARVGTSSTDIYLRSYTDAPIQLNSMGNFFITTITYFV